jgi:polysaccharide pyruvyl transferase WcaK-like protein
MTDLVLAGWVSGLIELSKVREALDASPSRKPGAKLKLLFTAYNGARNTGEDVRVEEMVRQFRKVLGEGNIDISVLTFDFERTRGYFEGATQVELPFVFPPFLWREIPRYDGVVACLGGMFQRTFSNAIVTLMTGALGIASARKKLSIAYGFEAGRMDWFVAKMCGRYCAQSLMIPRNEESRDVLQKLGVQRQLGTDTAWTFEPLGPEFGRKVLRDAGWDGVQPLLGVCPNRPFSWPVSASVLKGAALVLTGAFRGSHYRSFYFHASGAKAKAAYKHYLDSISGAVGKFREERGVFPVLIGMERLDGHACNLISEQLGGAPVFTSENYNMFELVSILRCCNSVIASRYHAVVTSMPGLVPSAGVSMDERIRNLMRERGHSHLIVDVRDPELEPKLLNILRCLHQDRVAVSEDIGRTVVKNLKVMARMGALLKQAVRERYPEIPVPGEGRSWEDYLPPLGQNLVRLVEKHERSVSI